MTQGSFTIWSTDGSGPYAHLPEFPFPPDEGDDEWRARARTRVWYHTAPLVELETIQREGLRPGGEGCVHLCVLTMEELIRGLWKVDEVVVLEVSLENLADEYVTPGYDHMEYCLAITCVIPPENVKIKA